MGGAGGVERHVASNPGGRWNSKWTFGKVGRGVFFPNSVDGVAVAWQPLQCVCLIVDTGSASRRWQLTATNSKT